MSTEHSSAAANSCAPLASEAEKAGEPQSEPLRAKAALLELERYINSRRIKARAEISVQCTDVALDRLDVLDWGMRALGDVARCINFTTREETPARNEKLSV